MRRVSPLEGGGVGLGWRPEIAGLVNSLPGLRFTEVVAEAVCADHLPPALLKLRERGVTVVPHGTRLSLGGAEPVDPDRVRRFAELAATLDAPLVSEHVAFVRAGGLEAGHLLPVPRTREALDALTRNIRALRAELDAPLALEPIATLFDWPDDELTEAQFLTELLDRTGTHLLLDVANCYANARNRGQDPADAMAALPLDRVAYAHVAGGAPGGGFYHDTHASATPPAVLELLAELCLTHRPPALLLERDGGYPPAAELRAELAAVAAASDLPDITRSGETVWAR